MLSMATRMSQKSKIFPIQVIFIQVYKNSEGKLVKSNHIHVIFSMFGLG